MGTHRLATQRTIVIMKFFVLLSTTLAAASAQYPVGYAGLGYAPAAYAGAYGAYGAVAPAAYHAAAPVAIAAAPAVAAAAPVAAIAPEVTSSQYRAEDEAGNTAYGYQNINNAAEQLGTANGNGVTGSYSYVDEAGHHSVSYVADDFGYRVIGRTRRSAQVAPVAYAGLAG